MKRGIISITAVIVLGLSFCIPRAQAGLITIEITAEVDYVEDEGPGDGYLDGQINVGDIITGTYTYESTTPDSSPLDPIQGNYWHYDPAYGISLTVGGFDFKTDPSNVEFQMFIRNNTLSGNDIYGFMSGSNLSLSNGTLVETIYWALKDHTGSVFSSDALPTTPPVLNQWQENALRLRTLRAFTVDAHVTSAIPEPATILLLGLGGLLLIKRN